MLCRGVLQTPSQEKLLGQPLDNPAGTSLESIQLHFSHQTHMNVIKMSILKSPIQPNGLKEINLGNSLGAFEKLLRDEYQRGNVGFQLDTHFLIVIFMDSIIIKVNLLYNKVAQISFYNKFLGKFNDIGIGSTLGTFMDTYPTAQYDDDQNFFYIPNSMYENMAFFFENPYSFALDNKLEEITINDLSLLVICSNT